MTVIAFTMALFCVSYVAGLFGALTGLGGGIVIVPVLVLLFKIDIRLAMGASLLSVMATSSGAALTFLKHHYTNVKVGMFLETGAIVGAIVGALLVKVVPVGLISIIFGLVLISSIWISLKHHRGHPSTKPSHPWAVRLGLDGHYYTDQHEHKSYNIYRVPLGLSLMTVAGGLSGLLGIGSGALKVLALDLAMGLPYKVSTSTSNFMIGMTASASMGVYLTSGYISPELAFPVMLGVLMGAFTGSRILVLANVKMLRMLFDTVVLLLAIQMIYKGITGAL